MRYHARDRDVIASGYPMTCIEDPEERLVRFLPHGTAYLGFPHLPLEGRTEQVADRVASPPPKRRRQLQTWRSHTLRFFYPGRAF